MYAITQFLAPPCLRRGDYWARLLILVPMLIGWSAIAMSVIKANGSGSGLPPIGIFISLAIIGTVIGRLRYIGVTWFTWLSIVFAYLFLLAPFAGIFLLAAATKLAGIELLAGPDHFQTILALTDLLKLPFAAVALIAGVVDGDPERLLKKLGDGIARKPGAAGRYVTRGKFLAGLGRKDEAVADFDMALGINPKMKGAQQAKEYYQDYSEVQNSALTD